MRRTVRPLFYPFGLCLSSALKGGLARTGAVKTTIAATLPLRVKTTCLRISSTVLFLLSALPFRATAADRADVTGYGAIANDGGDDTIAIQNAVNAYPGGSIYFPPGTYRFQGSLVLPQNVSYRLYGDGPSGRRSNSDRLPVALPGSMRLMLERRR